MTKKKKISEKAVRHLIQTILAQIVDVNNNVRKVQDDTTLDQAQKTAITNTSYYIITLLAVLLHEVKDIAHHYFPDAKDVIDYAMMHYKKALDNKAFSTCKCEDCVPVVN
jgi:hypothetical protein